MTTPVDWSDPCERARALSDAYFRLLSGQNEVVIRTRTLDAEEHLEFGKGANLATLKAEMEAAQRECAARQGLVVRPKRFAIPVGHRIKPGGY